MIALLQIDCRVCQWTNFERRSLFVEVMDENLVAYFFNSRCICKYSAYLINITTHCTEIHMSVTLNVHHCHSRLRYEMKTVSYTHLTLPTNREV